MTCFNDVTAASHISIAEPVMPSQKGITPSGLCVDVLASALRGVLQGGSNCKAREYCHGKITVFSRPT